MLISSNLKAYLKSKLGCKSWIIGPMRSEKTLYASSSVARIPTGSSYSIPDLTHSYMLPPLLVCLRFSTDQTSLVKCFLSSELKSGLNSGYGTIGTRCGNGPWTLIPCFVSSASVTRFAKYLIYKRLVSTQRAYHENEGIGVFSANERVDHFRNDALDSVFLQE